MYALEFSNQAKKFLKKLDKHIFDRIIKRLENLRQEPVPSDFARQIYQIKNERGRE